MGIPSDGTDQPTNEAADGSRTNVSFLNPIGGEHEFIYPAQVSCVVTGTDKGKSTVFMFVNNSFDDKDSVQHFEQLQEDCEGCIPYEPCTRGFLHVDQPIQDPEELFLLLLRTRIAYITIEWIKIIARLRESFTAHEPVLVCSLPAYESHRSTFICFLTVDIRPGASVSFFRCNQTQSS